MWSRKVFIYCKYCSYLPGALSATQSDSQSSQLVFSGQIFDLEQNDKMTSDCSRQIFVNVGVFRRLRDQLGGW